MAEMTTEPMGRADVLALLTNCPICGARLANFNRFGQGERSAKATFSCGAVLATLADLPLEVDRGCPSPSAVAVAAIEREIGRGA